MLLLEIGAEEVQYFCESLRSSTLEMNDRNCKTSNE